MAVAPGAGDRPARHGARRRSTVFAGRGTGSARPCRTSKLGFKRHRHRRTSGLFGRCSRASDTYADRPLAGGSLAAHKKGPLLLTPTGRPPRPDGRGGARQDSGEGLDGLSASAGVKRVVRQTSSTQVAALGFHAQEAGGGWTASARAVAAGPGGHADAAPVPRRHRAQLPGRPWPPGPAAGAPGRTPSFLLSADNALPAVDEQLPHRQPPHRRQNRDRASANQGSNALASPCCRPTAITFPAPGHRPASTPYRGPPGSRTSTTAPSARRRPSAVATGLQLARTRSAAARCSERNPGPALLLTERLGACRPARPVYLTRETSAGVQEIVVFGGPAGSWAQPRRPRSVADNPPRAWATGTTTATGSLPAAGRRRPPRRESAVPGLRSRARRPTGPRGFSSGLDSCQGQ